MNHTNVSTGGDNAQATIPTNSRFFQICYYQWLAKQRLQAKLDEHPARAAICETSMRRQVTQLKPARA